VKSTKVAAKPLQHPCFRQPDSVLEKLRAFHQVHHTSVDRVLADLEAAVGQLSPTTRNHEAQVVAAVLKKQTARRRGPTQIGALLPAVLAQLELPATETHETRDRS
jgi:hypothetical protein